MKVACFVNPDKNTNLFTYILYENLSGPATAQISSAKESSFSGLSCTNTTGSFYAPIVYSNVSHMVLLLDSFVHITTTFDFCLSNKYFVPLTIKLNQIANNEGYDGFNGSEIVNLTETDINNNTSQEKQVSLPDFKYITRLTHIFIYIAQSTCTVIPSATFALQENIKSSI